MFNRHGKKHCNHIQNRQQGDSNVALELSQFARSLTVETAFSVLAVAKALKAAGKDVVELEIGDSPFASTASAKSTGIDA
ncbi:MAG: hypothetical protein B7Z55_05205, partial [Planctomycetales bacterium 12-60-4]